MYYTTARKMALALASTTAPADYLREAVQVPLPQVDLFPPLTGYGQADAPTVADCMEQERDYPDARYDFSGSSGSYSGTPLPGYGSVW